VNRLVKIGERVAAGGVLAVIHARDDASLGEARALLGGAIVLGDAAAAAAPLVAEVLD
jgi:thymidine phosphorylase